MAVDVGLLQQSASVTGFRPTENGRLAYVEAEFPRASVTRTWRYIVEGAGSGKLSAETRQKNARSTTSKVARRASTRQRCRRR